MYSVLEVNKIGRAVNASTFRATLQHPQQMSPQTAERFHGDATLGPFEAGWRWNHLPKSLEVCWCFHERNGELKIRENLSTDQNQERALARRPKSRSRKRSRKRSHRGVNDLTLFDNSPEENMELITKGHHIDHKSVSTSVQREDLVCPDPGSGAAPEPEPHNSVH